MTFVNQYVGKIAEKTDNVILRKFPIKILITYFGVFGIDFEMNVGSQDHDIQKLF